MKGLVALIAAFDDYDYLHLQDYRPADVNNPYFP